MSTGVNCGQVRGPIQLTFGRSIEPITSLEYAITRMAVATHEEAEKQQGDNRTMGRKSTVPSACTDPTAPCRLPGQADRLLDEDLGLFWQALIQMFDHDRSAARGEMATHGLYVFEHSGELGNAPAYALFDRLTVAVDPAAAGTARSFGDTAWPSMGSPWQSARSSMSPAESFCAASPEVIPEGSVQSMDEDKDFGDETIVPLSAIEHFSHCPRQCALIHVEQTFDENLYTIRGRLLHEVVDEGATDTVEGVAFSGVCPCGPSGTGSSARRTWLN